MFQIYGHFTPKDSGNKVKSMFFFLSETVLKFHPHISQIAKNI